ncbi:MAG: transglutaminase domain-containing protein [Paramuribaculum sp.]|nr:transglutaminase domain-containing protein [Paramuribaculum sp.]
MKNKKLICCISAFFILIFSSSTIFAFDAQVKKDFEKRKAETNPDYFKIFERDLTKEQREALEFLYAYSPLPDIADNSGDYFLEMADYAIKARNEMPWGKQIPDREWYHFVLPVRVNNEALDGHRPIFYEELKERVGNMTMEEAILEINHWCHEKVTYQPSDSRTHSPLASVSSAIGRCGEESTFTVSALRSMGIPARQIYTPRWAHTDDNHAWVEAWADGKWYFMGACEPEPVLNLGWFNAPASRGMMMNTRVFGNYNGEEEVLDRPIGYTNINVTTNYASVDTIYVTVTDAAGKVVPEADVSFRLYNYGEFYPIAVKSADKNGNASLSSGLGDILIWATDGTNYGFTKGSVGKNRKVTVKLDRNSGTGGSVEMNIIPPPQTYRPLELDPEKVAENDRRKIYEDSLRGAYTATFMTPSQAEALAERLGLDKSELVGVMTDARGNHAVIEQFLTSTPEKDRSRALNLLKSLTQKDRSDVPMNILSDHINTPVFESPLYVDYIMSPRIDNEALTPFRSYFVENFSNDELAKFKSNPTALVEYVGKNIEVIPNWYPANVRMSPEAVHKSKVTNAASRDIYFVAVARTAGLPSRIDPVTGKTQWADADGKWNDVVFGTLAVEESNAPQGTLQLLYEKTGRIDDPKYYTQFTLSKIVDGKPQLLNYPDEATWSQLFSEPAALDEGQYMLVTGQRMADGGVLSRTKFITIEPNVAVGDTLILRQDNKGVQVIGNFNSEDIYRDLGSGTDKSILSTTGRGYYIIGLLTPNHEPTNHALRDIAALNPEFENWGRSMILLFKDEQDASRFDPSLLPALPSTATFGIDNDGKISNEIREALHLESSETPIFIIADTFNRIVFVSQGYTIGLGDQLVDTIHQLKE